MSDDLRQIYLDEARELLDSAMEALSAVGEGDTSADTINRVFRDVHSIKGGAGTFGFDDLADFAHVFENVLDRVRDSRLPADDTVANTLVRGGDVLADLVAAAEGGESPDTERQKAVRGTLAELLEGGGEGVEAPPQGAAGPAPESAPAAPATGAVNLRLDAGTLGDASPLNILRGLRDVGAVTVEADASGVPGLDRPAPAGPATVWHVTVTEADRTDVADVLDFAGADAAACLGEAPGSSEPAGAGGAAPPAVQHQETQPQAPEQAAPSGGQQGGGGQQSSGGQGSGGQGGSSGQGGSGGKSGGQTIRVDLDRVDHLINVIGELVIAQAMLHQTADTEEIESVNLRNGLKTLTQHVRELQETAMSVRAQPVRAVFSRMPKLVRDLTEKLGKKARLETVGEDTEVDRTVVEGLGDPLTHMIRNALDHGLEMPDERRAAGKPEEGTINLSAEQRGGRIVIRITDDGRGLNREKVLEKAVERGVVSPNAELSDAEIDNLIFAPGFSTADQVSDVSGRGVGMDVVKSNVESMGGRIQLRSSPGEGSVVTLSMPLTLAVMDGMVLRVGEEIYVLPLPSVLESFQPTRDQIKEITGSGTVCSLRGDYIPLVHLGTVFNAAGAVPDPTQALVIVVEAEGGQRIGLVACGVHGIQQVVVKSLEQNYQALPGVAAATILGDGRVALIIDADGVRQAAQSIPESWQLHVRREAETEEDAA